MNRIVYLNKAPDVGEYKKIYDTTGWKYKNPVTVKDFKMALEKTWYWICAYDNDTLVGIGRLISDGVLYAFVCDMIVIPEYQKQGIGSLILEKLKSKCFEAGIRRVWLFAASGKAKFYERNGFEIRPQEMPGMQLKDE